MTCQESLQIGTYHYLLVELLLFGKYIVCNFIIQLFKIVRFYSNLGERLERLNKSKMLRLNYIYLTIFEVTFTI